MLVMPGMAGLRGYLASALETSPVPRANPGRITAIDTNSPGGQPPRRPTGT